MEQVLEYQWPSYDYYLQQYQQRVKLRQLNFKHSGNGIDGQPRTAAIKTIQKFISKLKSDNKNCQAVLIEMGTLNLTKYLDEISSSLAICVNERDIPFYSEVATRLNLEYQNYPAMLLKDILKQFSLTYQSPDDNKPRLKSLLLFTTELFVCGFPFPYRQISEMLKKLVKAGTKKKSNFNTEKELRLFAYYYNCDIYAVFLKHFGTIFTSATPVWMAKWAQEGKEVPHYPLMIPVKIREDFAGIFFSNYVSSCISVLEAAFERIKQIEQELHNNLKMSGEFSKQLEATYNQLKQKFLFTKCYLEAIIQSTQSSVVVKPYEQELVTSEEIMKKYINKIENVEIFENEFEKELYNDLPEIKTENKAASEEDYKTFKQMLDCCKNKNESDEALKAFESVNSKRNRKLLAKDLLEYRKEYQLVTPFLCRIAAAVSQNYKDVIEWLLEAVFSEYDKLRETTSTNFVVNDKKSRNLKYICEFTKFKLIDPERTIAVIKNLIDDLKGYNIELLISALESVGRFLYLAPQHANKFTFMLSKLENVMKQKSLPMFTTSQLINSINLLKPHVETPKPLTPPLTPEEDEADKILNKDVISEIQSIIDGILKLIKTPSGLLAVQKRLLTEVQQYDFLGNYHYAYLLTQLDADQISDWMVEQTVSKLQEAVTTGNYQNCLLWSRFFGELYKYQLIKRGYLFDKLKSFLDLGRGEIGTINLVCTALQTCHGYLESKKIANRNQRFLFLVQFKKYIHRCLYVPMLEEFKIIDVFQDLQPNLTSIKLDVLEAFLQEVGKQPQTAKEVDYSKALDQYLDKFHLKEEKNGVANDPNEFRGSAKEIEPEQVSEEKNSELIMTEARNFDSEFLNVMNSHIKDLSGRIAKPTFVQKVIERRREKKKVEENEQKRTVIGRCGFKFVKKEVVFATKTEKQADTDFREA